MKILDKIAPKNNAFLLGIIISLMGSLPLGYINVIGLQILLERGNWAVVSFILGIVFTEFFVLKAVSFGAKWLVEQKRLLLFIDVFTIVFFSGIATYFIINSGTDTKFSLSQLQIAKYPFILGLLLNSLNFMQWPYWSGMYIYLFRTEKLDPHCNDNNIFIIGAMIGTLAGMLIFAHSGKYLLIENKIQISNYLNPFFALLFMVLAGIQIVKVFAKRRKLKEIKTISNK